MIRVRIKYAKTGWLKYTSNLDVQKIWERALRRARLPLAYSQGFNPQPRLNLAAPLPLGFTGSGELIDIWFTEELVLASMEEKISGKLPAEMSIQEVSPVDLSEDSLQSRVAAAEYRIQVLAELSSAELAAKVADLLNSTTLPRTRRSKAYDLRPLIEDLRLQKDLILTARLTMLPNATGRPEELLEAMQINSNEARIERTALILSPLD
jgi:radical SAM-linked protein